MKKYNEFIKEGAEQRRFFREKEIFDAMPDSEKKDKYDATVIKNKLEKLYPNENFEIVDYFDTKAKAIRLMKNSRLLNMWGRGSDNWDDGLNKEFASELRKLGLKWFWDNSESGFSWDHILISPDDYRNYMWYYNNELKPPKEQEIDENKRELINLAIEEFNKRGYKVREAEVGGDRIHVEAEINEMIFRFYIMKPNALYGAGNVKEQVDSKINKLEQSLIRHFKKIKEVYKYCEKVADGPLWTMCGGGAQLQQFYGDDNGYLCILYLDMENEEENKTVGMKDTDVILVVNGSKNDPKFKNFKSKDIEFKSHKEIWGDKY